MGRIGPTRRCFVAATTASIGLAAWTGRQARGQSATRLRTYWWGAKERADRTNKVDEMYAATHPGVTLVGETVGWGDYWTRLATEAAGRNMPDLIQMDYGYIFEYARRRALLPLDGFVGKQLDLSSFSPETIEGGKVDGKIYGVSLGLNSTSLIYDSDIFNKSGISPPVWPITWDELGKRSAALTKAVGRGDYWGMQDAGGYGPGLEVWLRERGKAMYNPDGRFGADTSDMADWFGFWQDMRAQGGCVPPEVQALDKSDIDTSVLTLGKAAIVFANSNQLVGYQATNKKRLRLAMYPAGKPGTKSGQYLKPSMLWSIAATTKYPEESVKLLSYFVTDAAAGKVLGVERGVPGSKIVRDAIDPTLDDLGQQMSNYVTEISDKVTALPSPPPRGAGEVLALLRRTNETIGFKRISSANGAKQFMSDCSDILSRA
jgi:multiple sugar transport system substrate-binding protein